MPSLIRLTRAGSRSTTSGFTCSYTAPSNRSHDVELRPTVAGRLEPERARRAHGPWSQVPGGYGTGVEVIGLQQAGRRRPQPEHDIGLLSARSLANGVGDEGLGRGLTWTRSRPSMRTSSASGSWVANQVARSRSIRPVATDAIETWSRVRLDVVGLVGQSQLRPWTIDQAFHDPVADGVAFADPIGVSRNCPSDGRCSSSQQSAMYSPSTWSGPFHAVDVPGPKSRSRRS